MADQKAGDTGEIQVCLDTEEGNIVITVESQAAPDTAAYFLRLIDEGAFDGATFHRSGASFIADADERQIIQGGVLYKTMTGEDRRPIADVGQPLLNSFETTEQSGLRHRSGTVSLARDLLGTGAAIPEIFICLRDSPEFDANGRSEPDTLGFPAFASVVDGMDVVRRISCKDRSGATRSSVLAGQILAQPVVIKRARRNDDEH